MSWDSVVIGQGDMGVTTLSVTGLEGQNDGSLKKRAHISSNVKGFRICNLLFNFGMTIFADTDEGAALKVMIDEKRHIDEVSAYLNEVLLRHIDFTLFESGLQHFCDQVYEAGRQSKQKEVLSVLFEGIDISFC